MGIELVAALRRGEVVAFQLDRTIGGRGDAVVPFFGAPAIFPLGPFVIAAAAGAPVVPAFCALEPDRSYRLHVEPALSVARERSRGTSRRSRHPGALREDALGSVVQLLRRLGACCMTGVLAPRVSPVAITGAGVVTAIGQDLDAFWAGLVTGLSGISEIEGFPVADLRVTRGGEIKKLRRDGPGRPAVGGNSMPSRRLAFAAARRASSSTRPGRPWRRPAIRGARGPRASGSAWWWAPRSAGSTRRAACLGDGQQPRRAGRAPSYDGPTRTTWQRWLGARGPVLTVTTACASGATSLGLGADLLRAGPGRRGGGRAARTRCAGSSSAASTCCAR